MYYIYHARSKHKGRDVTQMTTYLYHSFPRRSRRAWKKAEVILENMVDYGLLLVPELVTWIERSRNTGRRRKFRYVQTRICFTELSPFELRSHAESFGSYALEFTTDAARELGAIPVFYVPSSDPPQGLNATGPSMMHRLGEVLEVLDLCERLLEANPEQAGRQILVNNELYQHPIGAAQEWVRLLFKGKNTPTELANWLYAFLGHFYPTENLRYTPILHYYRQREWRISGRLQHVEGGGVVPAPRALRKSLLAIDREFFTRRIPVGGRRSCSSRCLHYPELLGRRLFDYVNRVICPKARALTVTKLLRSRNVNTPVIPLEECR